MSIFKDDEENDEEYYQAGRDVWAEYEEKRRDPDWFVKKNAIELMRSNPSYTLDAERKRVQKKQEEEAQIKAYRTQFPNVVKTIRVIGDRDYATLFTGEADLLAYQTRNSMKFNKLDQSQGMRIFSDGTRITVQSLFGQDIITIDVSQSTGEEEPTSKLAQRQCSITLINIPTKIQPMKNPGVIAEDEVQGVDYIKTYYQFDVGQCSDCQDIKMDFLFNYSIPAESRHYDAEIKNHCIYSISPPCNGEVIAHGQDALGDFFIWKAYTEMSYTRTGLGILNLKASISDPGGEVICDADKKIDVDCCLKDGDLRAVAIWWEHCTGASICELGAEFSYKDLVNYTLDGGILYTRPEVKGGCVPFEWSITGPGNIAAMGDFKEIATYVLPSPDDPPGCNEHLYLRVQDRCNSLSVSHAEPCCGNADPLEIYCISLVMACNQSQGLTVVGGCIPYTWSLTGGGGTLVGAEGAGWTAIYYSPATNPNCTSNPTITVTDCCGDSTSIRLAVNCYSDGSALKIGDATQSNCWWQSDHCQWTGSYYCDTYDCAGTLLSHVPGSINLAENHDPNCTHGSENSTECTMNCALGPQGRCADNTLCGLVGWGLNDIRSPTIKAAGCCPLNPFTLLPYD